jgi:plasmid stabilization system protein ParE
MLKDHPHIGRKTNLENVYIKIFRQYLIIYKIQVDDILIIRVWDGRRNPDEML